MNKVYVIGIGYRPLNARARELILTAGIILASKRLYEVFQKYAEFDAVKDNIRVINKVDETISFLHSSLITHLSSQPLVLLASGDPNFFGIGRKVLEEFGHDKVEILPDLSSIQLAFARIKEPWDNAFLISLHGGPDPEKRRRLPFELIDLPMLVKKHQKLAILTDRENNPSLIARCLIADHAVTIYVCERLGYPDEKVSSGTPEVIAEMSFSEPNVVVVIKEPELAETSCPPFGLKENDIVHSRGLITKDEVRAVSIHKLRLPQKGVFWDIGAGSGSVSIEIARLYPELSIYSIEKDVEQIGNIRENVARFKVSNIEIISGQAPDVLRELPAPDRVFIGGSSGHMSDIADLLNKTMTKGVIVINATTIETLGEAMKTLATNGFESDVSEISVSRSKKAGSKQHMSALNPVFIVKGEKK
ncbi:MAG: precorrin-6y C5,15-methyltransferase (decarboxylating) subunit CbiE [Nitrospirae bacterium]|nr:precorrin-6y C5,15-methyltransferase (decarboxylating) subunit CbiE [Nitrospirota bacterium]